MKIIKINDILYDVVKDDPKEGSRLRRLRFI